MKKYKFHVEDWHTLSAFLIEFASILEDESYSFLARRNVKPGSDLECEIESDVNPILIRRLLGNHCSDLAATTLKSSVFFDGLNDDVFGQQMKAGDRRREERFNKE